MWPVLKMELYMDTSSTDENRMNSDWFVIYFLWNFILDSAADVVEEEGKQRKIWLVIIS